VSIDWSTISLDDPGTYDYISEGNTFGVFQLESSGITEVVKRLKPSCFADMTALLAVYRPGPIESGMVDDFVERKNGRREIRYDHPWLEPILKETYGTILYQEQVMQIAQVLAGYSLGEADLMRRAMGKKKKEEMDKQRQKFVDGASAKGLETALAESIFNYIDKFAGYGFNKSHSAAYAVLSFRTAYLKTYYPVEYTAALMTNAIGSKVEDMAAFFGDARKQGIKILPPHVNESQPDFTPLKDGKVRFGLLAIKNVGEGVVEAIILDRKDQGPFTSFEQFCYRVKPTVLNTRVMEALIKVGAFDGLGSTRARLLAIQEEVLGVATEMARMRESGQDSLFSDMEPEGAGASSTSNNQSNPLSEDGEVSDDDRFQWEKDFLGHYVTGSPLDAYQADIEQLGSHTLSQLEDAEDRAKVRVIAEIVSLTIRPDRKGNNMAWVTVSDLSNSVELLFFSEAFESNRECLIKGMTCLFSGSISRRQGDARLMVNTVTPAEAARAKSVKGLILSVAPAAIRQHVLTKIRHLARHFPGRTPLSLSINHPGIQIQIPLGKEIRVSLQNDLLKSLQRLPGLNHIKYRLASDEG
jgi:DNA polymerase-3 subunit alpha